MGLGMGGDMSRATMGIAVTPDKVKAGEVAFQVTNASKDTIHEMVVARLKDTRKRPLPYKKAEETGSTKKRPSDLGEVSELDPGARGTLVIPMKPGQLHSLLQRSGAFCGRNVDSVHRRVTERGRQADTAATIMPPCRDGQGGGFSRQALPMAIPARNTMKPPTATWKAARRKGVSIYL